jgi:hypothetical protein
VGNDTQTSLGSEAPQLLRAAALTPGQVWGPTCVSREGSAYQTNRCFLQTRLWNYEFLLFISFPVLETGNCLLMSQQMEVLCTIQTEPVPAS